MEKRRLHLNRTKGYKGHNNPMGKSPYSSHPTHYGMIEDIYADLDVLQTAVESLLNRQKNRGQLRLTIPATIEFTDDNVYTKIVGTFTDGNIHNFTVDSDNARLIYTGEDGVFLATGISDLSIDKIGTVTYGLYKNGELVEGAETEHTFQTSARTSNISIVRICPLEKGDYIEVWAKSTDKTMALTVKTLMLTLWGDNVT